MENTLAIILVGLIIVVCSLVAVANLIYRRRRRVELIRRMKELESLKEQGTVTEEQSQFLKNRARRRQELSIEPCTLSAEEIMEAIDAALRPLGELARDSSYRGDEKWAEAFGIHAPLNLSLKELTLLSMKIAKPREATHLITEILAMNIPIDALEVAQKQGKIHLPRYEDIARIVWAQTRKRLSELISVRKELHKQRKVTDQSLLAELTPMIIKALHIPMTASGFAVILALMVAKVEFDAFSDESADSPLLVD